MSWRLIAGVLKCGDITASTLPLSKSGLSAFRTDISPAVFMRDSPAKMPLRDLWLWTLAGGAGRRCVQPGRERQRTNEFEHSLVLHLLAFLFFFKFHLLLFPLISTVISTVLWNSLPIQSSFFFWSNTTDSLIMFHLLACFNIYTSNAQVCLSFLASLHWLWHSAASSSFVFRQLF